MLHIEQYPIGLYEENSYLAYLDERDDCFAVDPGDHPELLLKKIESAGKTLTHILLTHGHFDHILAVPHLKKQTGANVLIHELDASMLQSSYPLKLPPSVESRFVPCEADEQLNEGMLSLCGLSVEALHTPGHTKGGMSFYIPAHKLVFTGDTLFANGFGRTDFAGGSTLQLRQSLARLFLLPGDTMVYSGHGEPATMAEITGRYR